jgi:hypothetical protein
VSPARRCEKPVKALRGEAKKRFDLVVEELRHRLEKRPPKQDKGSFSRA